MTSRIPRMGEVTRSSKRPTTHHGIRFARRITLAKGLRLNVSKSGLGLSVGPRGAAISIGPSGAHSHLGIPGTGLAMRQKIGGGGRSDSGNTAKLGIPEAGTLSVLISIDMDTGKESVVLVNGTGQIIQDETLLNRIKRTTMRSRPNERKSDSKRKPRLVARPKS